MQNISSPICGHPKRLLHEALIYLFIYYIFKNVILKACSNKALTVISLLLMSPLPIILLVFPNTPYFLFGDGISNSKGF